MSDVSLSNQLRRAADPIWAAQHAHPFLRGIGDGTLAPERFCFYVRQDYLFLIEYARLLALGAARAPDLATMRRFSELTTEILVSEMDLHRSFAAEFGISAAALEAESPSPTTQGYTDFLVRTAAHGDFAELAAALLPCMWGYAELGQVLAAEGRSPDDRYARWVDMYASAAFGELAAWCRALVDRLGAGSVETPAFEHRPGSRGACRAPQAAARPDAARTGGFGRHTPSARKKMPLNQVRRKKTDGLHKVHPFHQRIAAATV